MSLMEIKEAAEKHRGQPVIQRAFCRSTMGSSSRKFYHHTKADRLYQFWGLNFNNNIPEAVRKFNI